MRPNPREIHREQGPRAKANRAWVILHLGEASTPCEFIRIESEPILDADRLEMWTYVKNMRCPLLVLTFPGLVALSLYIRARSLATGQFNATLWSPVQAWRVRDAHLHALAAMRETHQPVVTSCKLSWNP